MVSNGEGLLAPHQVLPTRLIARAALVLGALVVLPLVLGTDIGIFTAVGLVLLAVAGLGAVPLVANVVLGLYALMSHQYPAGGWPRSMTSTAPRAWSCAT